METVQPEVVGDVGTHSHSGHHSYLYSILTSTSKDRPSLKPVSVSCIHSCVCFSKTPTHSKVLNLNLRKEHLNSFFKVTVYEKVVLV